MKTYKSLYPQIYDFANLYTAWRRARCGKHDRAAVASFEFDLERNLLQLQDELRLEARMRGVLPKCLINDILWSVNRIRQTAGVR